MAHGSSSKSIEKRDDCRLHQKIICSPTEIEIIATKLQGSCWFLDTAI